MENLKFKVNQRVKIKNDGVSYTTYSGWIKKHAPEFLNYWKSDAKPFKTGDFVAILAAYEGFSDNIYLVGAIPTGHSDLKVQIIGEEGLEDATETVEEQSGYKGCITGVAYDEFIKDHLPDWHSKNKIATSKKTKNHKYQIGDVVEITHDGEINSAYDTWVKKNAPDHLPLWEKSKQFDAKKGTKATVWACGKHQSDEMKNLYLIGRGGQWCKVIGENGITKAKNQYPLELQSISPDQEILEKKHALKLGGTMMEIQTFPIDEIPKSYQNNSASLLEPVFLNKMQPAKLLSQNKATYTIISWVLDFCIAIKRVNGNCYTIRLQSRKNDIRMSFVKGRITRSEMWSNIKESGKYNYVTITVSSQDLPDALADANKAVMRYALDREMGELHEELGG